jgi:hypothetical protein
VQPLIGISQLSKARDDFCAESARRDRLMKEPNASRCLSHNINDCRFIEPSEPAQFQNGQNFPPSWASLDAVAMAW